MRPVQKGMGFTLIELVIVVAIVAILAAVAFPAWTRHLQAGRRSDATTALMQIRNAEAKWRNNHTSYATLANVWSGTDSPQKYYTLAILNPTASGYVAKATPKTGGAQAGDSCGTFAISKSSTNDGPDYTSPYASQSCWQGD